MKMRWSYIVLFGMLYMLAAGCTKPYTPPVINNQSNYLVVEGVINTGGDSTLIRLSRSVNLSSSLNDVPELNATVSIQDDQNQSYGLKQLSGGYYSSAVLSLDNTRKYRISITTTDGKIYQSDYVPALPSPAIDSIGFTIARTGLQIYVNTHDPKNATHYYRWDYNETWIFHAKYNSSYISNDSTDMVPRPVQREIYQCWSNDISTNIVLGSSAKLTQDVIYQNPVTLIPSTSEKIEDRYSILLKEYALTSDAYNYYYLLKQNTEQLGSIFDAQPSELVGNIHCTTNASLRVIGYLTAGTIQQKRVFIDNSQLPPTWAVTYPYDCQQDTVLYYNPVTKNNDVLTYLVPPGVIDIATSPIFSPTNPSIKPIGYLASDPDCADCSIRGTTTQPSFWK